MSDIGAVTSYAQLAIEKVRDGTYPHEPRTCPCLLCADVRAYIGWPALVPAPVSIPLREERAG